MRSDPGERNQLSVKLELQADCLAGVWAHSTQERKLLEQGDVESAMNAAAAVGDDRLQKMSTGRVRPESFTHGSSAQRTQWFSRGMQQGSVAPATPSHRILSFSRGRIGPSTSASACASCFRSMSSGKSSAM